MGKQFKQDVSQILTSLLGDTPSHMITSQTRPNYSNFSRPLLWGLVASFLSILSGIVPDFAAPQPSQIFASAARADEFKDKDLRNYAAALVQIEPIRQSTLAQVSRALGGAKLPNLVCNQPSTMSGLNAEAKSLFVNYCNQCQSIASRHQLSIEQFNQITQALRSNPQLKQRVRSFLN
jgi:Domain of unknown function (DUF4168)